MIVGDCAAGELLDKHLRLAGISGVLIVGTHDLARKVNLRRPKAILALGLPAVKALIADWRWPLAETVGTLNFTLQRNYPVIPCYHPAYVQRNPMREYEFVEAIGNWKLLLDWGKL